MGKNVSVERGAALLDEKRPGWEERIDLDTLDLSDICNCVVGQLHRRDYYSGLRRLGVRTRDEATYGFVTRGSGYDHWDNLTAAWRRLILRRR